MAELPTGTVTFLLTDVEGSTRLWEQHPGAMRAASARHDALVEDAVERYEGMMVRPRGEGDSRFAVFARASDAVAAAAALQVALHAEPWPTPAPLRVRVALHTGEADLREGDYYGAAVNRCARLRAISHGGQILLSQTTHDLVRQALPAGVGLRDLGEHRMADLTLPERVFQVTHPALPADFPPLKSLDVYPNNLPLQLTSFVGREREIAAVTGLLRAHRLVTLTGTGGCGKTRLALQVAADLVNAYPDGVWLAELAPIGDPVFLPQTIARVLGVQEDSPNPMLRTLLEYLRARRLLLIVDNCEHLIAACAQLIESILRACPNVNILATSREALGLAGEAPRRVPSLTLPGVEQLAVGEEPRGAALGSEALQLFAERARAADASFIVTPTNSPALAQICRRLDGIPLALELAAARLKVLSVEQIAARLDDRFRLLTGGTRTALPRQQTLRATLDWSYNLLGEPERRLLQRLAVFAGGCTLEAAEVVCADPEPDVGLVVSQITSPVSREDILDLLSQLVDKSLVLVDKDSDEPRYRLLETIRQYGRDRLVESEEAQPARDRHRDWFLGLARRAEPEMAGPRQGEWLDRLEGEIDNLRQALEWSIERGPAELGLRLAGAVYSLWVVRDYWSEGRDWLARALAAPGAEGRTAARAKALNGFGLILHHLYDYAGMQRAYEECLAIYQEVGDRRGAAWAVRQLAYRALGQGGEHAQAEMLFTRALTQARETGDRWIIAQSLEGLGMVALERRDFAASRLLLRESLDHFRATGDARAIGTSLYIAGYAAAEEGSYAVARASLGEALGILRSLRSRARVTAVLCNLGLVTQLEGDFGKARALLEEGLSLARAIGEKRVIARALAARALLARGEGQRTQSMDFINQALTALSGDGAGRGAGAIELVVWGALAGSEARIISPSWSSARRRHMASIKGACSSGSIRRRRKRWRLPGHALARRRLPRSGPRARR